MKGNMKRKYYEETILDFEEEATFQTQDGTFSTLYVPLSCRHATETLLKKAFKKKNQQKNVSS